MPLADQITNAARKLIEPRPNDEELRAMVLPLNPLVLRFKDDSIVPNHPRWPLLLYRGAVRLSGKKFDPAVVVDSLFAANGWGRSWRDSIYDFVHYHSRVHEVLGVARGSARVEFGGIKGHIVTLHAGDVAILPAGTGHRLISASRGFLVVGAYPPRGVYDECTDTRDRTKAAKSIARVPKPKSDPVYGSRAGLVEYWTH